MPVKLKWSPRNNKNMFKFSTIWSYNLKDSISTICFCIFCCVLVSSIASCTKQENIAATKAMSTTTCEQAVTIMAANAFSSVDVRSMLLACKGITTSQVQLNSSNRVK